LFANVHGAVPPHTMKRLFHRYGKRPATAVIALVTLVAASGVSATPKIQTWHTDSGAKVLYVAAPDLPMVDVRVVFAAGSARDGDKPGLASMTAGMLTEGAGGLSADRLAERVESVGAQLSTGADKDMASASLRSLTEANALDIGVDSLTKVLTQPDFPPQDFERVRENTLIGLRRAEQDPASVGSKALYKAIYGHHPYASDPSGTTDSVAALTRDELIAFHRRYYTAPNATVAIVGAVDRPQAERLAERITAGLPKGEAAPPLPPVPDLSVGKLERIDFPSSQTHVYAGEPGMSRSDPDYFALYVGNHILGGSGLVSLLMNEVREKRGLSYSAYSYIAPMSVRGPMIIGLQTKNDQADQASHVMLDTLRRFVAEGPTDAELEAAVKNITGGFPLRIASNSQVVQYLAVIGFYDMPLDHLDRFNERVAAVTKEQIRDAFRRRVHPDRLAIVLVGGEQDEQPVAHSETAPAPSVKPAKVVPAVAPSPAADEQG
jgi:zinc protease